MNNATINADGTKNGVNSQVTKETLMSILCFLYQQIQYYYKTRVIKREIIKLYVYIHPDKLVCIYHECYMWVHHDPTNIVILQKEEAIRYT